MDKHEETTDQSLPAWLRLYKARKARQEVRQPATKPVGRPRRSVPMKQTTMWFSSGDRELIGEWQDYLGSLTDHSLSLGETVAILARISSDRLENLGGEQQFSDLAEFTLKMIGENSEDENA